MRHQLRVNRAHNERRALSLTITKYLVEYMWCHSLQFVTHQISNTLQKKEEKKKKIMIPRT